MIEPVVINYPYTVDLNVSYIDLRAMVGWCMDNGIDQDNYIYTTLQNGYWTLMFADEADAMAFKLKFL